MVDSTAAENSISKTGDKADGLGKKLGAGIATAAKFGAALVVGAGVAGAGMLALVNKTANAADEIDKLSERTGINREELQRWKYAAGQSGADIGKLEVGMKKLSGVMDDAANGNEKAVEGFNKLGISMDDLKNKSQEQIFEETMAALADMEEGAERNALGNDLLGKSYTEMLPLLNEGSDGMQALKDRADELGIVMSEDAVKANVVYGDTMDDLKLSFGAVFMELSNNFLPVLQKLIDWALANMPTFKEYMKTALDAVGTALKSVGGYIKDNVIPRMQALWDWIQPHLPMIKDAFTTAFDQVVTILTDVGEYISTKVIAKLQELWDWISPHMPMIKEAMKTAFDGVKDAISDSIQAIKDITKWFEDHWAIVEPILLGIAAGATAFYIITGAIAAYGAITKGVTALQLLFNAALTMNPIGIVVVTIGLLVAAGILLYRNWDVIKAKVIELWTMVKGKFTEIKTAVVNKVNELKVEAVAKFVQLVRAGREKFLALKDAIMDPINAAKDKIKGVIETIKGFFTNLKLKLPKIKTPSFRLKNWSMNPTDWIDKMPSIGIKWNAQGALFTKPTVFNTPMGLQGFGEAGPEAAIPLTESVLGMIGQKISDTMSQNGNQQIIIQPSPIFLDGKKIAEVTWENVQKFTDRNTNVGNKFKGVTT